LPGGFPKDRIAGVILPRTCPSAAAAAGVVVAVGSQNRDFETTIHQRKNHALVIYPRIPRKSIPPPLVT